MLYELFGGFLWCLGSLYRELYLSYHVQDMLDERHKTNER